MEVYENLPETRPVLKDLLWILGGSLQIQLKLCTHRQKYKIISYNFLDKMRSLLWKSNSLSGKPWRLTMKTACKRLNYHLVHSYRYNVVLWWKKKVSIDPKCKPYRMHTMIAEQTVLECLPCSVFQGALSGWEVDHIPNTKPTKNHEVSIPYRHHLNAGPFANILWFISNQKGGGRRSTREAAEFYL